ncbi:MAG: hypothetical protein M3209_09280 [Acidobacteriota bacterium]|nr:hypothetical protein [Acidobacteriota bacterium]
MNNRNLIKSKLFASFILLCLCLSIFSVFGSAQNEGGATSKEKLIQLLESKQYQAADIAEVIKKIGVNFQLTPEVERELVAAGARPVVIAAVRSSYRPPITGGKNLGGKSVPPKNPNSPKIPNASERNAASYEALIDEALALFYKEQKTDRAVETLQRAVKLSPRDSRAFQSLGFMYLYGYRNFLEAEKFMQKAVELGGGAVFRVRHSHDKTFSYTCTGSLYVTRSAVKFESDDNRHTFQTPDSGIVKIAELSSLRRLFQRKGGAFKIVLRDKSEDDKDTFNFSPLTGKSEESEMIIRLVSRS